VSLATFLPPLNAALNGLSALLLLSGWRAIRAGEKERHRRRMLAAFAVSCAFLASYLTRVLLTGTHRFPGEGWLRTGYLALLVSHTALAALCLPPVLGSLSFALRGHFPAHRRLARWTLPVWLYVSVTGVLVYLLLYQVAPALAPHAARMQ
jgi:putative membrane protein